MLMDYGERCAPPLSGLGWANSFMGLGAAARITAAQRKATALARRNAATAARKAKRLARVQGRTVSTSNPAATARLEQSMNALKRIAANAVATGTSALRSRNRTQQQRAVATMQSALKTIGATLAPTSGMRGLGTCVDDGTGTGNMIDNGDGQGCNMTGGGGIDPTTGQPYQQPYYPGGSGGILPQSPFNTTGLTTGLVPGFGSPFGGGIPAPAGCSTGSNLPRCLIYSMAQSEQQQFYFVFSILQQMYAQLLQIVQQLMQQLQSAQQQPGYPYSGYGPYGQPPYDPNNPYGGAGPYGGVGPYGAPYYAGGDTGAIPYGYGDAGGDPFGGGAIPGDVSQVFPGPGPGAPIAQGPDQASNIISSDGPLPVGAGPSTDGSDGGGGDTGTVPGFTPAAPPPMVVDNSQQSVSQPVNAGPGQPNIVVNLQLPGQSAYADATLPAGAVQNQPALEPPPPGETEGWSQDEGLS